MSVIQKGGISGAVADVDAATHGSLVKIVGGDVPQSIAASNGDALQLTDTGAMRVSSGALVFFDQVDGNAINTNLWASAVDTMVADQASGFMRLNVTTPLTTANKYAVLQSIKQMPLYSILEMSVDINAMVNVQPQSNLTIELGIGIAATNAAPTDGVFFRWNAQAQFVAVISNGGAETSSPALAGTVTDSLGNSVLLPPTSNTIHLYHYEVVESAVEFYVDDVLVATVNVPAGQNYPTNAGHQPLLARVYNGATPPSQAPGLMIGQVTVVQHDLSQGKSWGDILAGMGRGGHQSPTLFTQTTNHVNSANPGSATLSNTAAGYTTLGGRFQFAAPVGATTDYALFAFQIPVPYQFYLTGIAISALNIGAAAGVTPTVLDWAIGVNSSAVSLATTDGAGTWAPRRIPVGVQSFLALAAIGQSANDLVRRFDPPVVVDSQRYVHVILQVPVGLATGSQIIRGDVTIHGYYE